MLERPEIIILLPALGFLTNGLVGRFLPKRMVGAVGCVSVGLAFACALEAFREMLARPPAIFPVHRVLFPWIESGEFGVNAALRVDALSMVMALVVTGVGFFIHLYSVGYMGADPGYSRYFAHLNLFTASMLTLVMADNLLVMFVGWEAVGLCSYLLISFWYERPAAAAAGKKAFIVSRIGDFGFLLGLMLTWVTFGSLDFDAILNPLASKGGAAGYPHAVLVGIGLLLFAGATGKSAQIPLYVWLPDAMEGPTPVSALIHAATMVTAGAFMVARMGALYLQVPEVMGVIAGVGAATALLSASIALTQHDIKRVLAYSTISQLGYMFLASGVGAFTAAIFHLVTHAFFKALLFLGAGSVIHALAGEMDMRRMGGLARKMKVTAATFVIGALAISGIPPLAGFVSKDAILWSAWTSPLGGWVLGVGGMLVAAMTAFYMFRVVFKTFYGEPRAPAEVWEHAHESPPVMTIPLLVLGVLSVVGGWMGLPHIFKVRDIFGEFLAPAVASGPPAPEASVAWEWGLMAVAVGMGLGGIWLAWRFYIRRPGLATHLAAGHRRLYQLMLDKWRVDEAYQAALVRPAHRTAEVLWHDVDVKVIDGGVNGTAWFFLALGEIGRRIQTGFVRNYAFAMLVGATVIVAIILLR